MAYRWGLGSMLEIGGRAAAGAGVALALVLLRGGIALADYPARPAPPAGSGHASAFAGSEPGAVPPPVPTPHPGPVDGVVGAATHMPAGARPSHSSLLPGFVADPVALIWELLWLFGFVPGLLTPGQPCPTCVGASPWAPDPTAPRSPQASVPSPTGLDSAPPPGLATATPPVADTPAPVETSEPALVPSPAAATVPGPVSSADPPGSSLASTGTPVVTALAGVVLLAVGGYLTWTRERSSE